MTKFAYNNAKNTSISHTLFEFNCNYHSYVSHKNEVDLCLSFCLANKLAKKQSKLILIFWENLLHTQELQKRAHDKGIKSCSYVLGEKIWLNGKYIKIKQNRKLKNKFYDLFQVFYPVSKLAYKLELPTK